MTEQWIDLDALRREEPVLADDMACVARTLAPRVGLTDPSEWRFRVARGRWVARLERRGRTFLVEARLDGRWDARVRTDPGFLEEERTRPMRPGTLTGR